MYFTATDCTQILIFLTGTPLRTQMKTDRGGSTSMTLTVECRPLCIQTLHVSFHEMKGDVGMAS